MLTGNFVYAVSQWAVLGLFARLQTPTIVGQLVLALAVTAPVIAFFMLQLRAVQATDAQRRFRFHQYLTLRVLALLAALITIGMISLFADYRGDLLWMIAAVALSSCADGLSDTAYGWLQRQEHLEKIAQSMMLRGGLGLAAISSTLLLGGLPALAILSGAVVRLLIVICFDYRHVRLTLKSDPLETATRGETAPLTALLSLAAPLGLVMMLIVLNGSIPRYFVGKYTDQASLGVFGAISYLAVVGTLIVGALGESVTPRLARSFATNDKSQFLNLCLRLTGLGAALGAAGVAVSLVAGRLVLSVLYGSAYAAHADLLVWVMLASGVGYVASFSGYAITAARLFRSQIPLFAVVAATNAAVCSWLVPKWGLTGAAVSLLLAAIVQLVGTLAILGYGLLLAASDMRALPTGHLDPVAETAS